MDFQGYVFKEGIIIKGDIMEKIDAVLGVMTFSEEVISDEALRLLGEREVLRKQGNWSASDEIRKKLLEMGIEVSDNPGGMTWRLK